MGGSSISYNPVYNVTVADKYELQRLFDENNRKQMAELSRMIK
jgi:hypothetical protein